MKILLKKNYFRLILTLFLPVSVLILIIAFNARKTFEGRNSSAASQQVNIILDTDMASDIDDPKALVELNQFVRMGEVNLLGVIINVLNDYSAPAVNAINAWYGNGNVPIGVYKGNNSGNRRASPFNEYVAKNYNYPGNTTKKTNNDYPDALTVYRQALSAAPDNSVVILSLGFMTNLSELLTLERDLVSRKVKLLVFMGGEYPYRENTDNCWKRTNPSCPYNYANPEHNFMKDPQSAKKVMDEWPTEMVGVSFSVGADIFTGPNTSVDSSGPLAYIWSVTKDQQINNKRESWDSLAVLYTAHGLDAGFKFLNQGGKNNVQSDGKNIWEDTNDGKMSYLSISDKYSVTYNIETILNKTLIANNNCRFDARSLYTDPVTGNETDEITVGNFNYTRLGTSGWQRDDLTKATYNINSINYLNGSDSPCYNKVSCVFDTKTRYTDYYGKLNTSVTIGSRYYQWFEPNSDYPTGWWYDRTGTKGYNIFHDIASVSRWRVNIHAPCYGTTQATSTTEGNCSFDGRSVLYIKGSDNPQDYEETIIRNGKIYVYKNKNKTNSYKGWEPIEHDLRKNTNYNGANAPCYSYKNKASCPISDLVQYYDRLGNFAEFVTIDESSYDIYFNANFVNNSDKTTTSPKKWWAIPNRNIGVISRFLENNGPCLTSK